MSRPGCNHGPGRRCGNLAHKSCRGMCKKHYKAWLATHPPVDAAPVQAHIQRLRDARFGWRRISDLSGVAVSTLRDIASGVTSFCYAPTVEAVLAITPESACPAQMNPIGAIRRVQALIALGHTENAIADRVGMRQCNLWPYVSGRASWIRPATFDRIDRVFRELEALPRPEGWVAERARRRAARRGWPTGQDWGDTIDDPTAPSPLRTRPVSVLADFREEYLDLRDHVGLSDPLIAEQLRISYDLLLSRLSRLGIPTQNAAAERRAVAS